MKPALHDVRMRAGPALRAVAEAELGPGGGATGFPRGGGYGGPLAMRQGKGMRPDVAQAFDRMMAAARAAGVSLLINSAFRSDAEQAVLFARNPDPKWVAPPGQSLHRYATEFDLGPPAAYGWLAANARRFGFVQRYSWGVASRFSRSHRGLDVAYDLGGVHGPAQDDGGIAGGVRREFVAEMRAEHESAGVDVEVNGGEDLVEALVDGVEVRRRGDALAERHASPVPEAE